MRYLKKYNLLFLALVLLIGLYACLRLYHLTNFPIFTDESIYIRWSQIALNDASWRFISLTDGKQPMFVWIAMLTLKLFDDPVFGGRFVSVIAGFFSLLGITLLGREIFKNTKIGLFTGFLYVIYPFALMYDRLALYDSLVAMFIIWSLYFSILLVRHVRLDLGMILGMIIGGGMLTKSSANFGFILLPFSLLLFPFKKHFDKNRLIRWVLFAVVAFVIANVIYNMLRLSPFFHIIGEKNLTFIYSFHDWIQNPFAYVIGNLQGLGSWDISYLTLPFLVLIPAAFVVNKKYTGEKLLLLAWFIVPFMALAFFGKVIYPRFTLFMTMPLVVLGAYSLYVLQQYTKNLWLKLLIVIVFIGQFLYFDYKILFDINNAPLPQAEKDQMITGWAGGTGVKETITFLQEKAQNGKIFVGTEGTFGLMPSSLEMYLVQNPNITIKSYWPINEAPPQEILDASKKMPTYVVFYQPCPSCKESGFAPQSWPVKPVFQVRKPLNGSLYTLYQVTQ
jgi:4-amino-4-deoxy-L-arabinose transferase-like glycosyltransferase